MFTLLIYSLIVWHALNATGALYRSAQDDPDKRKTRRRSDPEIERVAARIVYLARAITFIATVATLLALHH